MIAKRFLGKKDKDDSHHRSKSTPPAGRQSSRSSGADAFRNIFNKNNGDKEENENDVQRRELEHKFDQVQRRIQELGYHDVGRERIEISISSEYAQGDLDKAVDYIDIQEKAIRGEIIPYNREVHMVGAENRGAVTCYLDTLLFSMFAKMDAFECMLKNDFPEDKAKDSLVKLLRMWVNMLRTGRLIGTDLTEEIQNSLAACGWPEAGLLEQQDTSEAFGFLTETLQLPLLSLQVDLFHHGKKDDADRKVVYERLLNLAVPEDPHGKGVKLEDCLEEYFNTRVEVNRDSEEAKKSKLENGPLLRRPSMLARNTIKILTDGVPGSTAMTSSPLATTAPVSQPKSREMDTEPECEHFETQTDVDVADQPGDVVSGGTALQHGQGDNDLANSNEVKGLKAEAHQGDDSSHPGTDGQSTGGIRNQEGTVKNDERPKLAFPTAQEITLQRIDPAAPRTSRSDTFPSQLPTYGSYEGGLVHQRPSARTRSTSVIQSMLVDATGRPASEEDASLLEKAKRKGSTVVKAVTIPAWQFFRLIPWHSLAKNAPQNDTEVAMNFDQRPVVGICLKRYTFSARGEPMRQNTYIDIPDSLRLPHFMLADGATVGEGENSTTALTGDYKLVLQSVICHRGDSLSSGHYISFARVAPRLLVNNRRHDVDPPPDYEDPQWVKFDDLQTHGRVQYVDDIKASLRDEMPYLLFYQIVPIADDPPSDEDTAPPSYEGFRMSVDEPTTPTAEENYVFSGGSLTGATQTPRQSRLAHRAPGSPATAPSSKAPSVRFSAELDRPRRSAELNCHSSSARGGSRPQSVHLTDSAVVSPALTPELQPSPALTPTDESTGSRLFRAATRFKSSSSKQSRANSQTGENRNANMMSRMAGLMRPSRDVLADPSTLNLHSNRASLEVPASAGVESTIETEKSFFPPAEDSPKTDRKGKSKDKGPKESKNKDKDKDRTKKHAKTAKDPTGEPERECSVM